jgi:hypothetical protein
LLFANPPPIPPIPLLPHPTPHPTPPHPKPSPASTTPQPRPWATSSRATRRLGRPLRPVPCTRPPRKP